MILIIGILIVAIDNVSSRLSLRDHIVISSPYIIITTSRDNTSSDTPLSFFSHNLFSHPLLSGELYGHLYHEIDHKAVAVGALAVVDSKIKLVMKGTHHHTPHSTNPHLPYIYDLTFSIMKLTPSISFHHPFPHTLITPHLSSTPLPGTEGGLPAYTQHLVATADADRTKLQHKLDVIAAQVPTAPLFMDAEYLEVTHPFD